nr:helix-turn-helix transcriptional regulator [uncultured Pedobacter sp.]
MSKEKHLIARQQLGLFFSERRKMLMLSVSRLAKEVGISENTMQRIEEGKFDYDIMVMFSICDVLEIKPYFVLMEESGRIEQLMEEDELQYIEPNLEDAHTESLMHSATFKAPTNGMLMQLKAGSLVKVCASGERFWIKVETIDFNKKNVIGKVDNDLINYAEHGLKIGDLIKFNFQNIYSIQLQ